MRSPMLDEARAYLDALEADRKAALGLSEQKAEEAKLIRARQEGFQAAMEILGSGISVRQPTSDPEVEEPVRHAGFIREPDPGKPHPGVLVFHPLRAGL